MVMVRGQVGPLMGLVGVMVMALVPGLDQGMASAMVLEVVVLVVVVMVPELVRGVRVVVGLVEEVVVRVGMDIGRRFSGTETTMGEMILANEGRTTPCFLVMCKKNMDDDLYVLLGV